MKKRFASLVIVGVFIILSVMSYTGYANYFNYEEITHGGIMYRIVNGYAVPREVVNELSGDVVIPEYVGNYPTLISNQGAPFNNNYNMNDNNFDKVKNITSITLPQNVKQISNRYFGSCESLRAIYIPANTEKIDSRAFTTSKTTVLLLENLTDIYYGGTESQWNKYIEEFVEGQFGGTYYTVDSNNRQIAQKFNERITVHYNSTGVGNYNTTQVIPQPTPTLYGFDVNPRSGQATINNDQSTGTPFTFTIYTSGDVYKVDICGKYNNGTNQHTIEHDYLTSVYNMKRIQGDNGIVIWQVTFRLNNVGQNREFSIYVNGKEMEQRLYITVEPNALQQENIKVTVNGIPVNFDVPPQIINGRTMIPVRAVAETLGCKVTWLEESQTALIQYYNPDSGKTSECHIKIGRNTMYCLESGAWINGGHGKVVELDSPAVIVNNRTLVPIRAIAEAFDFKVDWDEANKNVIITK